MSSAPNDSPPPAHRWLDRDLVVAASAIVISLASLVVSVQQTRLMREQQQASVWPRLTMEGAIVNDPPSTELGLRNAGIGPARVIWGQVRLDGTPITRLDTLLAIAADTATTVSVKALTASITNDVLTPGQTKTFLRVDGPLATGVARLGPRLTLDVCYCSVFDTCWRLTNAFGRHVQERVTEVPTCPAPNGPTL
jgi:hypothetical protein